MQKCNTDTVKNRISFINNISNDNNTKKDIEIISANFNTLNYEYGHNIIRHTG